MGIFEHVAVLGWLWLASPFVLIALISNDPALLASVARNLKRCRVIGGAGAATMLLGVMLVPGPVGVLMFIIGTPLTGLAVWRGDDGDDGGEQPPEMPPINWDEFDHDFAAHVRRHARLPGGPRTPSAR